MKHLLGQSRPLSSDRGLRRKGYRIKGGNTAWKAALSVLFLLSCVTGLLLAYEYGPPPGTTGDFGDPNCTQCHLGNPLDAGGGLLTLSGVLFTAIPVIPQKAPGIP